MESFHIILDDSLNERSKLYLNNNFFETKIKLNRKTKRIQKLILILILLILKGILIVLQKIIINLINLSLMKQFN